MTEQILSIPFSLGLDESTRPELVDPQTSGLVVANVEQASVGALTKTLGYEPLSKTRVSAPSPRTAGLRLLAHGDVPGTIDGEGLDLWINAADTSQRVDNVPPFSMTSEPVFAPKGGYDGPQVTNGRTPACSYYDFVTVGDVGVCVYSWITTPGVKTLEVVVWSVSTRAIILQQTLSTGSLGAGVQGIAAQLVACTNTVALFFEDGTANTIKGALLDATDITTAALGLMVTAAAPVIDWTQGDFAACSDGTKIYLVYDALDFLFNPGVSVARFLPNVALTLLTLEQNSTNAFGSLATAIRSLACDTSNGNLWVLYSLLTDPQAYVGIADPANTATLLSTVAFALPNTSVTAEVIHLGIRAHSASAAWCMGTTDLDVASGQRRGLVARKMTWTGAWAFTPELKAPSLATCSAPFDVGGKRYAWVMQNANVLNINNSWGAERVVACIALDEVLPGNSATAPVAPIVALPSPRLMAYASTQIGAADRELPIHPTLRCSTTLTGAGILLPRVSNALGLVFDWITLETDDSRRWQNKHMGGATHIAGAVATQCDGVRVTEENFAHRPRCRATDAAGVLTGTFSYVAIFEDTDATGQIQWSSPSDPFNTGPLVTQTVTVSVSTLAASRRRASRIAIYRTTDGGSTYYRLANLDNDPSVANVTYVDTTQDATLQARQRLYGMGALPTSAGASQPRQAPPGLRQVFRHGDRLVGIAHDRATLWYSAPTVQGEGRWFSDVFQIPIDSTRPLTAAWSQDGSMIAATETELWAISGDGPPENGGNGTEFSSPQRISSDVGCIESRSVVTTSDGTFFQASRGIHVLSRALAVEWIGLPVASTLVAFPVIVAAVHDQSRNVVMFDCNDTATPSHGVVIAYDLMTKKWSTEKRYEVAGDGAASVDSVSVRVDGVERQHWLKSDGTVYRRRTEASARAYLDTTAWRTARVSTAWFKVAGLAGYGQIKRLDLMFKLATNTDIAVSYFYDDNPTAAFTINRTAAELVAAGGRLDLLPEQQKCRTFRVSIEDATPGAGVILTGKGLELYGLALGYDPLGGIDRRSNASR